ncbi:MAG: excinuclease ABC subunit UvrC, partial [Pseudomonadota bacterium]
MDGSPEVTGPPQVTGPQVIERFVALLPNHPGVYRMLGRDGAVLYVGKARNLKKRVQSYCKTGGHTNRIALMVSLTADMEFVTTRTETEALLLEANLIKQLKPRFNIILRDDKSFPYILLRTDHEAPQVLKHRGARTAKGHYFGPFASAGAVNRTLNTLQRAFLLRSCTDSVYDSRTRPCLLFQIKRCSAPCTGEIDQPTYDGLVEEAVKFLRGRSTETQTALSAQMQAAADTLDFERAAQLRDRIRALTYVQSHQGINPAGVEECDVIAAHETAGQVSIQVFFFRAGQNWGNRAFFPKHDKSQQIDKVLEAFVGQFYDDKPVPALVLISHTLPQQPLMGEALTLKSEHKVSLHVPQRGEKRDLMDHALANAREALGRRLAEKSSQSKLLDGLAEAFDLETRPERIEVYDNSHIQGAHAVGAMVVAGPEGFVKNQYRKFNIKSEDLSPGDDFGMMREVLTRRFARLVKSKPQDDGNEDTGDGVKVWPDLVLIDGGQGQLSAARAILEEFGIDDIALVGIAKGRDRNAGREEFHQPGKAPFR